MSEYSIGIDLGTQSIRAAILDFNGKVLGMASRAQDMLVPKPGWAVQDPSDWWEITCNVIRQLLHDLALRPEQILAVGVGAQMHGAVPVARDGRLLSNAVQLYCDKRAAHIAMRYEHCESTYLKTANMPTANWQGFKIKWIEENEPEVYEKTGVFLTPKDFINFRLCGQACIDPSEGMGTYLMDCKTCQFDDALIQALGLEPAKLPRVADATEVIGVVSDAASKACGLAAGTKVVAGGGDMFCSLLTCGMSEYGTVADLTGTSSLICYYNDQPLLDKRIMNLRHVMDGWVAFGDNDNSGGAYKWLKDTLAKKECELARQQNVDPYQYLDELAQAEPHGAGALLFFPYLMGERTMGTPFARGMFVGLTPNTSIGAMSRAVLEGVAFDNKRTLDVFEQNGGHISSVIHCGGGAKSKLWSQIKADIYQKPVYTLENSESGVVAAGILAATGAGAFSCAQEGAKLFTKMDRAFWPDKDKAERSHYLYEQFTQIHDHMQQNFIALAKMP